METPYTASGTERWLNIIIMCIDWMSNNIQSYFALLDSTLQKFILISNSKILMICLTLLIELSKSI